MNFRNDIQGFRALAVIFVFIFHLSSGYLPGGFIGVDMFFVISGYLITKIIMSKLNKDTFDIKDFYLSRIKRIAPAYFFLLMVVWIIFLFLFTPSEISKFRSWHFWAFIFNSNNHFAKVDDYFGASSNENPLLHTWTLSVEMQFYLILPLLLLIIRKIKLLIIILSVISIGLISYSTMEIITGNKATMYFSLLSRSPEFFIGSLLTITNIEGYIKTQKLKTTLGVVGILVLIGAAFLLNDNSFFPGVMALIPCIGMTLLLISNGGKVNKLFSNKIFVYIGEISYSIYLWHWPIMAFLRYKNETYAFGLWDSIFVVIATILLSLLSYYFIEKSLRTSTGIKFYFPFVIIVTSNIIMIFTTSTAKKIVTPIPVEYGKPIFGVDSHSNKFKRVEVMGDTLAKNKRILFIGDSHAHTFKPYLDKLGKQHQFKYRTITNDLYPTFPNLPDSLIKDRNRLTIYKKLNPVINKEIDSADVIIVLFAANNDGKKWRKVIENMLAKLKINQRALFISDYPSLDKNPARTNSILRLQKNEKTYKLHYPMIDEQTLDIIKSNEKSKYVDLSKYLNYFKDAPYRNDTLIYYDSSHLNYYGVMNYANLSGDEFMRYLNWALLEK